ncbi:SEP-domain-containing protein [Meira miltonrushii]|uniref:SEP-domain-containing protein n=1 Tax=Meira miltonrushii TaxID=1280837 RepID=A0A316V6I6_9BASI|nr:SEP-domain-containing protein [Meira miltonrushii]PWN32101.1 SEP-domain-containing protein [Meira miltonrushii]
MDEAISQFISITGSDAQKAKFYVESANGDVQEAVSTFFEADGGEDDVTTTGESASAAAPSGPRTLSGAPAPPLPEGWGSGSGSSSAREGGAKSSGGKSSGGGGGGASSRFASLSDFRSSGPGNGEDDDDDEEDGPRDGRDPAHFFTGGERSGLSVQNPDHGRRGGAPNVVQDILQRARQMAERHWGEGGPAQGGAKAPSSFAGQGRTLGEASSATAESGASEGGAAGGSSNMPGGFQLAGEGARDEEENNDGSAVANRRIIFWTDGFSLEDGPLCRYDDPAHAHTLAMINQGAAPLSFLNVRFGQRVNLTVEQKQEKYTPPPPPPMKPFGGSGNRLGSPATSLGASSSSAAAPTSQAEPATPSNFEVDSSKPTTQLQIRLADGQRMVGRFNLTHTVRDVRGYINAGHPGMSSRPYVLQTSFPPKPVSDENQTLQEAGLANAVIIQKWS